MAQTIKHKQLHKKIAEYINKQKSGVVESLLGDVDERQTFALRQMHAAWEELEFEIKDIVTKLEKDEDEDEWK